MSHLLCLAIVASTAAAEVSIENATGWTGQQHHKVVEATQTLHHKLVIVAGQCEHCTFAARELRRYVGHVFPDVEPVIVASKWADAQSAPLTAPAWRDFLIHTVQLSVSVVNEVREILVVAPWVQAKRLLTGATGGQESFAVLDAGMEESTSEPRGAQGSSSKDGQKTTDAHLIHSMELQESLWESASSTRGPLRVHVLTGARSLATLYSVYWYVEQALGVRFYPHGDVIPPPSVSAQSSDGLKEHGWIELPLFKWALALPQFSVRGVNTWGLWTEGFDWWTKDNWRGFATQLTKMRLNFLGVHSYPEGFGAGEGPEPTVWIGTPEQLDEGSPGVVREADAYASSYTTTLKLGVSQYVPKPTSMYAGGAGLAFPSDCCCGVNTGLQAPYGNCPSPGTTTGNVEVLQTAAEVLHSATDWAHALGIRTAVGTEAPLPQAGGDLNRTRALYQGIFSRLNATLGHSLAYYWLWTPEFYEWGKYLANSSQFAAAVADMLVAHQVWLAGDWPFQLATAGWTLGPMDNSSWLDGQLPEDFAALSALVCPQWPHLEPSGTLPHGLSCGRTHLDPGYSRVTQHRKWVVPWLEADDALGWPQLWVNRTLQHAKQATALGVDGLIALHWRTEEVAPQFAAFAQSSWQHGIWNSLGDSGTNRSPAENFWLDFAASNFAGGDTGSTLAVELARVFQGIDGDKYSEDGAGGMPYFTHCCPGHIEEPASIDFCTGLEAAFAFLNMLEAARPRVKDGKGGNAALARLNHWIATFTYHRSGAHLACLWADFEGAFARAEKAPTPADREAALKGEVLNVYELMISEWDALMEALLQAVNTRGALGTLMNMEALTRPKVLDAPGMRLAAALGVAFETLPTPALEYRGPQRLFQVNVRSVLAEGEPFLVEAVVLSKDPPTDVKLLALPVPEATGSRHGAWPAANEGRGGWLTVPLKRFSPGRGVYSAVTGYGQFDFKYYLEARWADNTTATFPEAALDGDLLSVVVAPMKGITISDTSGHMAAEPEVQMFI